MYLCIMVALVRYMHTENILLLLMCITYRHVARVMTLNDIVITQ